mmetsp:Transcript_26150/g.72119  ORF Transcript_26150/g.72119 Transcript_26150/m.72119 type:complete len:1074 (-) Transcript_26150:374-3595(-)
MSAKDQAMEVKRLAQEKRDKTQGLRQRQQEQEELMLDLMRSEVSASGGDVEDLRDASLRASSSEASSLALLADTDAEQEIVFESGEATPPRSRLDNEPVRILWGPTTNEEKEKKKNVNSSALNSKAKSEFALEAKFRQTVHEATIDSEDLTAATTATTPSHHSPAPPPASISTTHQTSPILLKSQSLRMAVAERNRSRSTLTSVPAVVKEESGSIFRKRLSATSSTSTLSSTSEDHDQVDINKASVELEDYDETRKHQTSIGSNSDGVFASGSLTPNRSLFAARTQEGKANGSLPASQADMYRLALSTKTKNLRTLYERYDQVCQQLGHRDSQLEHVQKELQQQKKALRRQLQSRLDLERRQKKELETTVGELLASLEVAAQENAHLQSKYQALQTIAEARHHGGDDEHDEHLRLVVTAPLNSDALSDESGDSEFPSFLAHSNTASLTNGQGQNHDVITGRPEAALANALSVLPNEDSSRTHHNGNSPTEAHSRTIAHAENGTPSKVTRITIVQVDGQTRSIISDANDEDLKEVTERATRLVSSDASSNDRCKVLVFSCLLGAAIFTAVLFGSYLLVREDALQGVFPQRQGLICSSHTQFADETTRGEDSSKATSFSLPYELAKKMHNFTPLSPDGTKTAIPRRIIAAPTTNGTIESDKRLDFTTTATEIQSICLGNSFVSEIEQAGPSQISRAILFDAEDEVKHAVPPNSALLLSYMSFEMDSTCQEQPYFLRLLHFTEYATHRGTNRSEEPQPLVSVETSDTCFECPYFAVATQNDERLHEADTEAEDVLALREYVSWQSVVEDVQRCEIPQFVELHWQPLSSGDAPRGDGWMTIVNSDSCEAAPPFFVPGKASKNESYVDEPRSASLVEAEPMRFTFLANFSCLELPIFEFDTAGGYSSGKHQHPDIRLESSTVDESLALEQTPRLAFVLTGTKSKMFGFRSSWSLQTHDSMEQLAHAKLPENAPEQLQHDFENIESRLEIASHKMIGETKVSVPFEPANLRRFARVASRVNSVLKKQFTIAVIGLLHSMKVLDGAARRQTTRCVTFMQSLLSRVQMWLRRGTVRPRIEG